MSFVTVTIPNFVRYWDLIDLADQFCNGPPPLPLALPMPPACFVTAWQEEQEVIESFVL